MKYFYLRKKFNISHTSAIHHIWETPGISRIELSRLMQLNKSSVSRIIEDFKQWVVVLEEPREGGGLRGRPSVGLQLCPQLGLTFGIELRRNSYQLVSIQPNGHLENAQYRRFSAEEYKLDFSQLLYLVLCEVGQLLKQETRPILGLGLGLGGIVNPFNQSLLVSDTLGISQPINLESIVAQTGIVDIVGGELDTRLPVQFSNDAHCYAAIVRKRTRCKNLLVVLGELEDNAELGLDNSPIRIGMGFILNGAVHYGTNFASGEFQSIFKQQPNLTQFNLRSGEESTLLHNTKLLYRILDELCANIAFLVASLNLDEIYFAGNIVSYAQQLSKRLEPAVQRQWPHSGSREVPVYFSEQGELAVAMGAATTVQQGLFSYNSL